MYTTTLATLTRATTQYIDDTYCTYYINNTDYTEYYPKRNSDYTDCTNFTHYIDDTDTFYTGLTHLATDDIQHHLHCVAAVS